VLTYEEKVKANGVTRRVLSDSISLRGTDITAVICTPYFFVSVLLLTVGLQNSVK